MDSMTEISRKEMRKDSIECLNEVPLYMLYIQYTGLYDALVIEDGKITDVVAQ